MVAGLDRGAALFSEANHRYGRTGKMSARNNINWAAASPTNWHLNREGPRLEQVLSSINSSQASPKWETSTLRGNSSALMRSLSRGPVRLLRSAESVYIPGQIYANRFFCYAHCARFATSADVKDRAA